MSHRIDHLAEALEAEAKILAAEGLVGIARQALEEARQWRWLGAVERLVQGPLVGRVQSVHATLPETASARHQTSRAPVKSLKSLVFKDSDRLPSHKCRDKSAHRLYSHYYEDLLS